MKILKIFLITGFLFGFSFVFAQINPFDIEFPIPELGSCASMEECKSYCDDFSNQQSCADWAEAKGFIQQQQHPSIPDKGGPGNCQSEEECDAYCKQPEHNEECLNFGVEHGMISREEADKIRKEMNKTGPGGCRSKKECDDFCFNPDNVQICLQFAVDEGMISQEEADFLLKREKMHRAQGPDDEMGPRTEGPQINEDRLNELMSQEGFVGPGGCKTMDECDNYCSSGREEECFNFALENGLISENEAAKFKKIMENGPGGCRGQIECDAYCSNPENQEECMRFAIENELMPPEEIEKMKKMMELDNMVGPGGCMGMEECGAYCSQLGHNEECFNFVKEHGLMSSEEIQMMEREMEIMKKLDSGDMAGPGGCQGPEECDAFCSKSENMEECMNFAGDHGMRDNNDIERKMEEFKRMEPMIMEMGPMEEFMMPKEEFVPMPPKEKFMPPPEVYMPAPPEEFMPPKEEFTSLKGDYESFKMQTEPLEKFIVPKERMEVMEVMEVMTEEAL